MTDSLELYDRDEEYRTPGSCNEYEEERWEDSETPIDSLDKDRMSEVDLSENELAVVVRECTTVSRSVAFTLPEAAGEPTTAEPSDSSTRVTIEEFDLEEPEEPKDLPVKGQRVCGRVWLIHLALAAVVVFVVLGTVAGWCPILKLRD